MLPLRRFCSALEGDSPRYHRILSEINDVIRMLRKAFAVLVSAIFRQQTWGERFQSWASHLMGSTELKAKAWVPKSSLMRRMTRLVQRRGRDERASTLNVTSKDLSHVMWTRGREIAHCPPSMHGLWPVVLATGSGDKTSRCLPIVFTFFSSHLIMSSTSGTSAPSSALSSPASQSTLPPPPPPQYNFSSFRGNALQLQQETPTVASRMRTLPTSNLSTPSLQNCLDSDGRDLDSQDDGEQLQIDDDDDSPAAFLRRQELARAHANPPIDPS